MRVALVSPYDLSVPGGVAEHVRNLGTHLARVGHDVHVVAPASSRASSPGARLHVVARHVASVPSNGSVARIAPWPRAALTVARTIRALDADVVHVHEPAVPVIGPAATLAARQTVIATFHAARDEAWRPAPVLLPFLRALARRIDRAFAVSEVARLTASRYGAGAPDVVPNGVDVAAFRRPAPAPVPMSDGRLTVLFLGRLDARKGFPVLVEAFAAADDLRSRARLVVAGPHARVDVRRWRARCRASGIDDVAFVGCLDDAERVAYLRHATVTCAPSTSRESQGVVLLEAMAAGSPVVAAANAGFRSVVRDGYDGALVPPHDAGALARALVALLDDPARRRRLALAGLETARAHDWPDVAARIAAMYRETIGARGDRPRGASGSARPLPVVPLRP